jgi:hypothetical protein
MHHVSYKFYIVYSLRTLIVVVVDYFLITFDHLSYSFFIKIYTLLWFVLLLKKVKI